MTAMNPATSLGTSGGDCVVEGHNVHLDRGRECNDGHLLIVATSSNRKSKASVSWATNSSAGYHKAAWPTNSWLDLEGLNAFQDNGLVQRSGASTTSQLQQVKAPKDGHALTASDTATDERNVVIDARTSLGLDLLADPPRLGQPYPAQRLPTIAGAFSSVHEASRPAPTCDPTAPSGNCDHAVISGPEAAGPSGFELGALPMWKRGLTLPCTSGRNSYRT